jgi:hypothetical protein
VTRLGGRCSLGANARIVSLSPAGAVGAFIYFVRRAVGYTGPCYKLMSYIRPYTTVRQISLFVFFLFTFPESKNSVHIILENVRQI